MPAVIVATFVAFVISLFGTPLAIRFFTRLKVGQQIRVPGEIPAAHHSKQGTPTMGGVVFILATVVAYAVGHVILLLLPAGIGRPRGITATAVVLLGLFVCTGLVGFLDDFLKVRRRNSSGLNKRMKVALQLAVGVVFGTVALYAPSRLSVRHGDIVLVFRETVGSDAISFVRDIPWLHIGKIGMIILFACVVVAASNGVNLTDGLDGLATGTSVMVLGAYTVIAFWQYRHWCPDPASTEFCYSVRDPLEIALIAAAAAGACFGFLWWNASPARIFMGDTGALGLGGLMAGLAMATKTLLLLAVLGGLFVIITFSVIIQIVSFRSTGRRVFRMAPLQHHFELVGWSEVNIVIRFWIIAAIGVALGLGLFYADFLAGVDN